MSAKKDEKRYRALVGIAWPAPRGNKERRAEAGEEVSEGQLSDAALEHFLGRGLIEEVR